MRIECTFFKINNDLVKGKRERKEEKKEGRNNDEGERVEEDSWKEDEGT